MCIRLQKMHCREQIRFKCRKPYSVRHGHISWIEVSFADKTLFNCSSALLKGNGQFFGSKPVLLKEMIWWERNQCSSSADFFAQKTRRDHACIFFSLLSRIIPQKQLWGFFCPFHSTTCREIQDTPLKVGLLLCIPSNNNVSLSSYINRSAAVGFNESW